TQFVDAANHITSYQYDALDRRLQKSYPDGASFTAEYDANGNAVHLTDAKGTVVSQTFDAANRLTARSVVSPVGVSGAMAESYTWDGLNRIVNATSGNQTVTRVYDSLSRLTQETVGGMAVKTTYDDGGNATGLAYPSGLNLARTFDPLGRALSV